MTVTIKERKASFDQSAGRLN